MLSVQENIDMDLNNAMIGLSETFGYQMIMRVFWIGEYLFSRYVDEIAL